MNKYIKYLWVVLKHKYIVMIECFKMGLYWQWITHDNSKLRPAEFIPYANFIFWERTDRVIAKFKIARHHHIEYNHHHPECWENLRPKHMQINYSIPKKYLKEMACDYIWAGKVYNKKEFTRNEPKKFWMKKREWVKMSEKNGFFKKL